MNISGEKACFKKPVLPEKPMKKPAFNLPAGFFNKTWVFQAHFITVLLIFSKIS